jgi:hypothetical protein
MSLFKMKIIQWNCFKMTQDRLIELVLQNNSVHFLQKNSKSASYKIYFSKIKYSIIEKDLVINLF